MRVLYVNAMNYGQNQGVDAIAQGLNHALATADIEMRTIYADFREEDWKKRQSAAVRKGIEAGVDGIVLYVLDPENPADAVADATRAGIPVFALERPKFEVTGSVVYPNFNHGVYMSEYLASIVPSGARVGVIGGPPVVDDIELLLGIVHGLESNGLNVVNDPHDDRYRNVSDVASGGYEKVKNLLADFDDLDALVPFNDETMLGALQALEETDRLGTLKMVSRNGTPKAVKAVLDGVHHGTWDLDCPGIGASVGELVVRNLKDGENLDGLCVASPIGRMITPENAPDWVPWEERIAYQTLPEGLD